MLIIRSELNTVMCGLRLTCVLSRAQLLFQACGRSLIHSANLILVYISKDITWIAFGRMRCRLSQKTG